MVRFHWRWMKDSAVFCPADGHTGSHLALCLYQPPLSHLCPLAVHFAAPSSFWLSSNTLHCHIRRVLVSIPDYSRTLALLNWSPRVVVGQNENPSVRRPGTELFVIESQLLGHGAWVFTRLLSFADTQTRAPSKSLLPVKSKEVDVSRLHSGGAENDVTKIIKPRRENGWESEHWYPVRTSC